MTNPFGLVYDGALEAKEPGKVNIRPVRYTVDGIEVAANLYLPADYDEESQKTYPAVTVAHPNGGCKEQVAGLYTIPGASHIRTYWVEEYVRQAVDKLADFFGAKL